MICKKTLVLLPLTLVLAACGGAGGGGEPTGQVLATVDGQEITTTDLRAELGGASAPNAEGQKQLERMALQNIVNRTLLANAAIADGLDKGPEFAVAERRAKQMVLVDLYNAKSRKAIPAPSPEEVRAFIAANPAMFSQRKTFVVDQVVVSQATRELAQALQPATSLDQAKQILQQRNVRFSETTGVIDALTLPPEAAKQITALPQGEVFVIPASGGMRINQIRSTQTNPIADDQAQAIAREMLTRQRVEGQLRNQAQSIVTAGAANVKYNPEYAPPAPPAGGARGGAPGGAAGGAAAGSGAQPAGAPAKAG